MKILYVASNPLEQPTLLVEKEQTALAQSLSRIDRVGAITFVSRPHTRVEDLQDLIMDELPEVLHVAGHMANDKIIVVNEHDQAVIVEGDRLADFLSAVGHRFKLIMINACTSETLAEKLLVTADFVVGTTNKITNRGARMGAVTLYGRLARAYTVSQSLAAASSMLRVLQSDDIRYVLKSSPGKDPETTRLAEPFRILAAVKMFDQLLEQDQPPPHRQTLNQTKSFSIQYGIAGAPPTTSQLVFFTDDPEIAEESRDEPEMGLSWIVRTTPVHGEIWIDDSPSTLADINWFAAITTGDGRCFITKSTLCNALKRYYLDEGWRGQLGEDWRAAIITTIDFLRSKLGSKRIPAQG